MRRSSLVTKPPPLPLRSRPLTRGRFAVAYPTRPVASAGARLTGEEQTLIVFCTTMAIAGSLPLLGLISAYWSGWPGWIAKWLAQ